MFMMILKCKKKKILCMQNHHSSNIFLKCTRKQRQKYHQEIIRDFKMVLKDFKKELETPQTEKT